ncbi:hypothetical protein GOP47_0004169 [Adiantum capillus-veneris]|uniref:Choline transporter-like protein n=1 Tax=Adiantum capillus-veneris TaxID=13818 RepID=A0A9D4V708_ADICA|nr:hypothetical protein GOP47_0004169 [Adiantum capillus-veneris]
MGNIESGELLWDNTFEPARGGADFYRDDDVFRDDYYRNQDWDAERTPPARTPARTAPPSPAPPPVAKERDKEKESVAGEELRTSEPATPAQVAAADEIVSEAAETAQEQIPTGEAGTTVTNELNISKSQKTNQVAPESTSKSADVATTVVMKESRRHSRLRDLPFALLFIFHMLLVAAGILFLNVVYLRDITQTKLHNLIRWFPQLGAAIATGGLFALICQALFRSYPTFMVRSILWASSILTFGAALMLISTSVPANLGVGILCLIFSICQSLYACWVTSRIKYAADLLVFSLNTAKKVQGTYWISTWVLAVAAVWVVFWSFGVVSALTFELAPLVVLALLVSLAWTLETLRNVVCTYTARGVAAIYMTNAAHSHWDRSLLSAFTSWFGSICLGSLIVPILHVLRVVARGLNRIHGENEFMFSCADCFLKVTDSFTKYANNWAYVQVAVHGKGFLQASRDTFNLFKAKRLDIITEKDLTSSFCVLSGISGGMLCVLVSGGWTFGTHKALTSSVSVVSFFIGYFLVRITMAVPQGAVCAHYVCYCEESASPELAGPVPERLKELLADSDAEMA